MNLSDLNILCLLEQMTNDEEIIALIRVIAGRKIHALIEEEIEEEEE